jgi:hypothetical protein
VSDASRDQSDLLIHDRSTGLAKNLPDESFICVCGQVVWRSDLKGQRRFRAVPLSDRQWARLVKAATCEACDWSAMAW